MSKTQQENEFKAVEFQRKRRKDLSELYNADPIEFWKRLGVIRKKYRNKFRQQIKQTA